MIIGVPAVMMLRWLMYHALLLPHLAMLHSSLQSDMSMRCRVVKGDVM
jgi:hypothetical protein